MNGYEHFSLRKGSHFSKHDADLCLYDKEKSPIDEKFIVENEIINRSYEQMNTKNRRIHEWHKNNHNTGKHSKLVNENQ